MCTWWSLRWIPFAVDEAATWHVDPVLRQHEQRSDCWGQQSEEEAECLQRWAACISRMSHKHQRLPMEQRNEIIHYKVYIINPRLHCGSADYERFSNEQLLYTHLSTIGSYCYKHYNKYIVFGEFKGLNPYHFYLHFIFSKYITPSPTVFHCLSV